MPTNPRTAYLEYAGITLLSVTLFTWLVTCVPGLMGVDSYFHMRYSQKIWQEGIPDTFPHLVYTIYSQNFADDHFLFHIIQIPFTFGNLITGAKIYGVVFGTLVILIFFFILKHHHIRFAPIWTLALLASSAPFLFRIGMARAPSLSLCILLIATALALSDKDRWFLPLSFIFVWLYGGFPLIAGLASSVFFASFLTQKKRPHILLYCGLGISLGLIIHPYFPDNITFLYKSYTQIEFADVVTAGNEDYPYASSTVVRNAFLPWALMLATATFYFLRPEKLSFPALILFTFSTLLLCMYMNVRRFVEYWPVFAVLFSAFALNPYLKTCNIAHIWATFRGKFILLFIALFIGLCGADTLNHVAEYRASDRLPISYSGAAKFLQEASEKGTIVFTGNWDDFPLLYHFNTHNRYIVGLDPHYLYYYDAQLYDVWLRITKGNASNPVNKIKTASKHSLSLV
ncbi:MAG: hypothetical protein ACO36I_12470 [Candidatus Latescibacterota bacterium]